MPTTPRSGNVEDVGGEDEAPDAHEQGGVEESATRPEHEGTSMRPASRVAKKAKVASARASVADAAVGAVAAAAVAVASAMASAAVKRRPRTAGSEPHVGDEQPSYYAAEGEHRRAARQNVRAGSREAEAEFANLPCRRQRSASRQGSAPADERSRGRARKSQPQRCARPSPPRAGTAPSHRLQRAAPGTHRRRPAAGCEAVTEDASSSSAPVRKGWWQRKLGGE